MYNTIFLPGSFPIGNLPRVLHYLSEYYGVKIKVSDIRLEDIDVEVDIVSEEAIQSTLYIHGNSITTLIFHEKREDGKGYKLRIADMPESFIEMKENDGFHYE